MERLSICAEGISRGVVTLLRLRRASGKRGSLPQTITESTTELRLRLKQTKDVKQRPHLQALYCIVSGHARDRQELTAVLGVHRQSVAA
jgi:hypothetical protein